MNNVSEILSGLEDTYQQEYIIHGDVPATVAKLMKVLFPKGFEDLNDAPSLERFHLFYLMCVNLVKLSSGDLSSQASIRQIALNAISLLNITSKETLWTT